MTRTLAPIIWAAAAGTTALADDVYRNTTTPLGTFHTIVAAGAADGVERGNAVRLAGPARFLTAATVMLRIGGTGVATYNATLRLYANDGPAGSPGTRLWEGQPRPCIIDSGGSVGCSFNIPGGVVVPTTLTWTLQVSGRAGFNQGELGLAHFDPPTVGSGEPGVWDHSGGVWTLIGAGEAPLGAVLVACYPNCDGSTQAPVLNVGDFVCFMAAFAGGDPYANCDNSIGPPALNVLDFTCFMNKFAAGCQ